MCTVLRSVADWTISAHIQRIEIAQNDEAHLLLLGLSFALIVVCSPSSSSAVLARTRVCITRLICKVISFEVRVRLYGSFVGRVRQVIAASAESSVKTRLWAMK